jgi:hypothetical protein
VQAERCKQRGPSREVQAERCKQGGASREGKQRRQGRGKQQIKEGQAGDKQDKKRGQGRGNQRGQSERASREGKQEANQRGQAGSTSREVQAEGKQCTRRERNPRRGFHSAFRIAMPLTHVSFYSRVFYCSWERNALTTTPVPSTNTYEHVYPP